MLQDFFYDEQLKRYILQFVKLFSSFQVQYGQDRTGQRTLLRVPVKYGDTNRQAATIIASNSENIMASVPMISCYITNLRYDRERVQDPSFVSNMSIRQRVYDPVTDTYGTTQGNAFTVERLMPVPHTIEMKVDIWTSNSMQKHQLIEQILCWFNPSVELQSTDNYIDWTSLTVVERKDITWSSRTVPVGTEDAIDIATITFEIPIWLTTPAKIKKLGVIQKIVANVRDAAGNFDPNSIEGGPLLGQKQVTALDYGVLLVGNQLQLLKQEDLVTEDNASVNVGTKVGTDDDWHKLVNVYGILTDGISQVRLLQADGYTEVVGTVAYHPTDRNILLFSIDAGTKPANTMPPIDAIINPLRSGPGAGLPLPTEGTRYLLTDDIGNFDNAEGPDAWQSYDGSAIVAHANDIIQWSNNQWDVVFDSQNSDTLHYVSNKTTGLQYKWKDGFWSKSFEGKYEGGLWSLVL
jgi:hypothetical protein